MWKGRRALADDREEHRKKYKKGDSHRYGVDYDDDNQE